MVNCFNCSTKNELNLEDIEELKLSGLADSDIAKLSHFSIENKNESYKITGIKHRGLVFSYINPATGKNYLTSKGKPFYRMKPRDWNESTRNWHEDPPKYLSPPKEGNRPYWSELLKDFNRNIKRVSVPLEIVEGEKKADSLAAEGFFVLGIAGVWGWLDREARASEIDLPPAQLIEDNEEDRKKIEDKLDESRILPELLDGLEWRGRRVNISYDSDLWEKPGVRVAAEKLALALLQLGALPYIIRLPSEISGAKNGPDDFKVRHGIEAYRVLCKYASPAISCGKTKYLSFPTDPGTLHKIMLAWSVLKDSWRYRPGVGWYEWKGASWALSSVDQFEQSLTYFQDAQGWILIKGVDVIIRQLKSRLLVGEKDWNPPHLLSFANGTLDQSSGEFREHRRTDFCSTILPYDYDPAATCPNWLKFLNEAQNGDIQVIELLQAFCKWILIPKSRERNAEIQKSLDIVGCKGSGKGTFLDIVTSLVGPENTGVFKTKTFDNPNYLASLLDKKVAIDYDASGFLADVGTFNSIVSNEAIPIKVLFKDAISARLCTTVIRAYNRTLEVPDGSEGLDRRVIVVPFNHPPKEVDLELSEKLQQELPGIFAWAWSVPMPEVKRRLTWAGAVPAVAEASIKRFEANNPEYCFLLDVFPTGNPQVKAGDLYSSYVDWCKESGYSPKKIRKFGEAIQPLGCQRSNKSHGYFYYSIPVMTEFDLIDHMGLKQKTKNDFHDINTPQSSPFVPIPYTARLQLSPELSPNPSQLSPELSPEPLFEQKNGQKTDGNEQGTDDFELENRGTIKAGGQSGDSRGGQLNPYAARDGDEWGRSSPIKSLKSEKNNSIGIGDWVRYRKDAPEGAMKVTCSRHLLQVLDFRSGENLEALVKRSTWAEGHWIALRHLIFAEPGEIVKPDYTDEDLEDMAASDFTHIPEEDEQDSPSMQGFRSYSGNQRPKIGDRVFSEVLSKYGEVTKANSRNTYVLWDSSKDKDLPPTRYENKDIEILRIGVLTIDGKNE